jgi:ATP-dependent Clp protease protease subunit
MKMSNANYLVLNHKRLPSGETLVCKVAFNAAQELLIYDYIMPQKFWDGDTSVTPSEVMDFLKDAPTDISVRINSSGGAVGAALAIYNRLLEHPGKVTTIVDGYAFSSAGWLALAGHDRQICNGGLFMAHNPSMYTEVRSLSDIDNIKAQWVANRESIKSIFTARTSMKAEDVSAMMDAETYYSASEAVERGLFHSVRNAKPETAILNCLQIPSAAMNKVEMPKVDLSELQKKALNLRRKFL